MTATKKTVCIHSIRCIGILCLFMLSGCVRQVSTVRDKMGGKARDKMVEIPASLGIELDAEREQEKDIKSGMAYKPATFLFGDSTEHSSLAAEHGEYEDIPLPIGVTDVRYEIGQGQVKSQKVPQKIEIGAPQIGALRGSAQGIARCIVLLRSR